MEDQCVVLVRWIDELRYPTSMHYSGKSTMETKDA